MTLKYRKLIKFALLHSLLSKVNIHNFHVRVFGFNISWDIDLLAGSYLAIIPKEFFLNCCHSVLIPSPLVQWFHLN